MFRKSKATSKSKVDDEGLVDVAGNNITDGNEGEGDEIVSEVKADDDTIVAATNPNAKAQTVAEKAWEGKRKIMEVELKQAKLQLAAEKTAKRKLYSSLVKLATELKRMRMEEKEEKEMDEPIDRAWYQGGMWRAPQALTAVVDESTHSSRRQARQHYHHRPLGLTDLFVQLVVVVALVRVGAAISLMKTVTLDSFLYFGIVYMIWNKELSYSTRFEASDLSYKLVNLLTCFVLLFGTLSSTFPITTEAGTRMMMIALAVTGFYLLLYIRVAFVFRNDASGSGVKSYALFSVAMLILEGIWWGLGIFYFPVDYEHRWVIFVVGLVLSIRLPRSFLPNDFHAASSKRGVLFIALLGFLLQSVFLVATPFFEYQTPSWEQYAFFGACCLFLFSIMLLYVDDSNMLNPDDHSMFPNRFASICFELGNFGLLFAVVILGSGLDLLTHSYLAATAALPVNSKQLVCGGFAVTVFCVAFMKSMQIRRVPTTGSKRAMFMAAYFAQAISMVAIVALAACMSYLSDSYLNVLSQNELTLMMVLSGMSFVLVLVSWLDEAVELSLYKNAEDSRQSMVQPFGLWWCLRPLPDSDGTIVENGELADDGGGEEDQEGDNRLSDLSPLLGNSVVNMKIESERPIKYDAVQEANAV